jgi:TM2 domain-containing membrane protein YozV
MHPQPVPSPCKAEGERANMTPQSELTPEQRQRIYLEEKARLEIRDQLEAERKAAYQARPEYQRQYIQGFLNAPQNPVNLRPTQSNGVAAVLSLFVPGAGQMYKDKVGMGLIWLFATVTGYFCLILPGLFVHLFCIFNAYSTEAGSE